MYINSGHDAPKIKNILVHDCSFTYEVDVLGVLVKDTNTRKDVSGAGLHYSGQDGGSKYIYFCSAPKVDDKDTFLIVQARLDSHYNMLTKEFEFCHIGSILLTSTSKEALLDCLDKRYKIDFFN